MHDLCHGGNRVPVPCLCSEYLYGDARNLACMCRYSEPREGRTWNGDQDAPGTDGWWRTVECYANGTVPPVPRSAKRPRCKYTNAQMSSADMAQRDRLVQAESHRLQQMRGPGMAHAFCVQVYPFSQPCLDVVPCLYMRCEN
jgi:hypothetical protein